MTKPYAIQRLTFGGVMLGAQQWSIGISGIPVGTAPTESMMNELCLDAQEAFVTCWNSGTEFGIGGLNPSTTTFDEVRGSYTPAGSATATVIGSSTPDIPSVGSASSSLPTQTALVVSLGTGLAGRSNRGRVYLPMTGYALSGHFVASGDVDQLALKFTTFLEDLNAIAGTGYGFGSCVAGKSAATPITGVRIDNRPDIQRRRADKVVATHVGIGSLI